MTTTNVSFALLDAAVIAGRGDDPVVGQMTHARLLEEVAALGGVLHHLGVGPAVPVVIDFESGAESDMDAVVAALAAARIGGVVTTRDHVQAPVVVAILRLGGSCRRAGTGSCVARTCGSPTWTGTP